MQDIPVSIFKAYDIRGLSPGEITEEIAYCVGQAVVLETGAKLVVVGRDMRQTSVLLEVSLIEGIKSRGADVRTIGLTTTPMFYFAVAKDSTHEAGVMVTASHNPSAYNGFKMVRARAVPIGQGSGMEHIRDAVIAGRLPSLEKTGLAQEMDVLNEYVAFMNGLVSSDSLSNMKIVIDAGNGMAGHTLPALLASYPSLQTEHLYFELDGRFPNHEANPLKIETLDKLRADVVSFGAAFGAAYDGDADRIGIVDERGEVVESSLLLALLAPVFLEKFPGAKVLYDVRCSKIVSEVIVEKGGTADMCRVGHAFIKKQLRESGAVMAGELSGHFYFKDFFGVESTDLVFLTVAALLTKTGKKLSELIAPLRKYAHSGEINFKVEDKQKVIAVIEEKYGKDALNIWREDGVRLDFKDWWVSLRSSNTEPLLRLVLEAQTGELMEEKKLEISKLIEEVG